MLSKTDLPESEAKEEFDMFKVLWNKFMLVLLNYADQAENINSDQNDFYASVQPL